MVDPSNTLNILDSIYIKKMGLHLHTFEHFHISIPNHKHISCEGVASKVELTIKHFLLNDDYYIQIVDSKHISKFLKKACFGLMTFLYYMKEDPFQQTHILDLPTLLQKCTMRYGTC